MKENEEESPISSFGLTAEREASRLFDVYFSPLFDLETYPDMDWGAFLVDLMKFPELAYTLGGLDAHGSEGVCENHMKAFALQYAIVCSQVPVRVIEKLVALNPGALEWSQPDHGWTTIQWVIVCMKESAATISPRLLELILRGDDTGSGVVSPIQSFLHGVVPVDWFIAFSGVMSPQVAAIFNSSPMAVKRVLRQHQNSESFYLRPVSTSELVTRAYEYASKWEEELGFDPGSFLESVDYCGAAFTTNSI